MSKTLLLILAALPPDTKHADKLNRACELLDVALFDPRSDAEIEKAGDLPALELRKAFVGQIDDLFVSRPMLREVLAGVDKDAAAVAKQVVDTRLAELLERVIKLEVGDAARSQKASSAPRDPELAFVTRKDLAEALNAHASRIFDAAAASKAVDALASFSKSAASSASTSAQLSPSGEIKVGTPVILHPLPGSSRVNRRMIKKQLADGGVHDVEVEDKIEQPAWLRFDCSSIRIELKSGEAPIKGKVVSAVRKAKHHDEVDTVGVDFDGYGRTEVPVSVLCLDDAAIAKTAANADAADAARFDPSVLPPAIRGA